VKLLLIAILTVASALAGPVYLPAANVGGEYPCNPDTLSCEIMNGYTIYLTASDGTPFYVVEQASEYHYDASTFQYVVWQILGGGELDAGVSLAPWAPAGTTLPLVALEGIVYEGLGSPPNDATPSPEPSTLMLMTGFVVAIVAGRIAAKLNKLMLKGFRVFVTVSLGRPGFSFPACASNR
jgi:hypothetical protein